MMPLSIYMIYTVLYVVHDVLDVTEPWVLCKFPTASCWVSSPSIVYCTLHWASSPVGLTPMYRREGARDMSTVSVALFSTTDITWGWGLVLVLVLSV